MSKLQENIAKAEGFLARFKDSGVLNRINGEDVPADDGSTFETISPLMRFSTPLSLNRARKPSAFAMFSCSLDIVYSFGFMSSREGRCH
ncbi:MAG: hypothetical protein E6Q76_07825, partial [Rhizobium sp.]